MTSIGRFLWMWLAAALGLWLADLMLDGMSFDGLASLITAGGLLALVNLTIKPLLMLVALPVTLLSFGLMIPVLNGLLLLMVAWLIPGFFLAGFWTGVLAALLVSLLSILVGAITGQARLFGEIRSVHLRGSGQFSGQAAPDDPNVIDVQAQEKGAGPGDRDQIGR